MKEKKITISIQFNESALNYIDLKARELGVSRAGYINSVINDNIKANDMLNTLKQAIELAKDKKTK